MTKIRVRNIFFLLLLFLVACKDTGSPQAVAEKFLFNLRVMDIETAKSLSTKNTWGLLDIMVIFTDTISVAQKEKYGNNMKLKITDVKKESDSTVIVTFSSEPKFLPFNKIRMLKTIDLNGRDRWKVDISTLDLVEGEDLYIEEENLPVMDEANENVDSLQRKDSSVVTEDSVKS